MKLTWGQRTIVSEQVILTLHFLIVFWGYATFNPMLMVLALCINIIIVLSARNTLLRRTLDPPRFIIMISCSTLLLMLPFAMYKSPFAIFHGATGVASVLAAFVIARYPQAATSALRNTLIVVQVVTLEFLQTTSETIIPLDHMIEGASSNGITSFLIVLQTTYLVLLYRSSGKFAIFTAGVTLYICILGYGRGSILAAMLLLLILVGFYSFTIRKPIYRLLFLAAQCAFVAFLFYSYWDVVTLYLNTKTKISAGLVDDARSLMWSQYLSKIDFITLIIGADFTHTVIKTTYNGNPHSAFIRMHHFFGLPYVMAILVSIGTAMIFSPPGAARVINSLAITTIIFRTASEPILFPTPLDLMFFLCVFSMTAGRECLDKVNYKGRTHGALPSLP